MSNIVENTLYKHFKGNTYKVLSVAKHTETCEDMVIYQCLKTGKVWARPLTMFSDNVDTPDYKGPRFTKIL